jgi:ABC-2 type transport system ATP-binding protein
MVETHDLRHTFRTRKGPIEAVRGVDLEVAGGEVFGFLGPNGAGKTTTLRMLATLLPPTGGSAMVAGADLRRDPGLVRRSIGYVAQGGSTDPRMTGRRELVMQARVYDLDRRTTATRIEELLDTLQLTSAADRPTGTWSGGMRRRLDVALGIVHRPPLLFLDEPTTGLDPQSRARMWDEIRALAAAGTTIFLTTHYLEEADELCDRVAIIDHGRIVAADTPTELKRQVAGDVVTLGVDRPSDVLRALTEEPYFREGTITAAEVRLYVDDGERAVPAMLRTLDGQGFAVRTLHMSRPTLADVFLRQTGRELRDEGKVGG